MVRDGEGPAVLVKDPAKARKVTKAETATWDKPGVAFSAKVRAVFCYFPRSPANAELAVCVVYTTELEVHCHRLGGRRPV